MKKIIKALIFVIMLFVATSVKADNLVIVSKNGESYFEGLGPITVKHVRGNESIYAFCLDSIKPFVSGTTYSNTLPINDIPNAKVKNVFLRSYIAGLGNEKNEYGISNTDLYLVTQMAVWHAAHGSNHDKGGYEEKIYGSWLDANSLRRNAFNSLVAAENEKNSLNDIKLNLEDVTLHLSEDEKDYVSDGITVSGPNYLTYTVTASKGSCILYNGKCLETQNVEFGKEFNLVVNNDGSNNISATATVKATKVLTYLDFNMLTPLYEGAPAVTPDGARVTHEDGFISDGQRIGVAVPSYSEFTGEITGKVVVEEDKKTPTDEVKKVEIKVCKSDDCDVESQITVRELVKDKDSNVIYSPVDSWTAKSGEVHKVDLKIDTFYRIEDSLDSEATAIYIKVTTDGEVKLCNIKDKDINTADCENITNDIFEIKGSEIIINDCSDKKEEATLTISKKDFTTGKEIPGAHLQIFRVVDGKKGEEPVYEWISTEEDYIIKGIEPGEYILVETIPAPDYDPSMIILGEPTTEYKFNIVEGKQTKIDVYNDLKTIDVKVTDVPNTGISTKAYIIGGFVMLVGAGTIVIAKKKENM